MFRERHVDGSRMIERLGDLPYTGLDQTVRQMAKESDLDRFLAQDPAFFAGFMKRLQRTLEDGLTRHQPRSLYELHRALYSLYELNFGVPGHAQSANQFHPFLLRIRNEIEHAWERAETSRARVDADEVPGNSAGFAESFKERCAQHRLARHPLFDFLEFKANHDKNMTPSTPSIPHIYGLKFKLDQFEKEGLDNRYARHRKMAQKTRDWAKSNGFELFPKAGYESVTLTCVKNNKNIDVAKLQKALKDKYKVLIDGGYGPIKGKSFRLAHMGDETPETVAQLHTMLDDCLKSL